MIPKSPELEVHTAEKGAINISCTVDHMNLIIEARINEKVKFLFKVNNFWYIQPQWLNVLLKFAISLCHYKKENQNCRD